MKNRAPTAIGQHPVCGWVGANNYSPTNYSPTYWFANQLFVNRRGE